jgi:hypothetical protein
MVISVHLALLQAEVNFKAATVTVTVEVVEVAGTEVVEVVLPVDTVPLVEAVRPIQAI